MLRSLALSANFIPVPSPVIIAGIVAAVIGLVFGLDALFRRVSAAARGYARFRGKACVTCPESKQAVGVTVDVRHLASTTLLGRPDMRLAECARWPERQSCGQECLGQLEAAPENCLVRNILTRWYHGKTCSFCRRSFGVIHWHDHKPAVLIPEKRTVEWNEIPVAQVWELLRTGLPVCWNCHIAETFRREHPDLIVDRPWAGAERQQRML